MESEDNSAAPQVCSYFIDICDRSNLRSQIKAEPASPTTAVQHTEGDEDIFMSINFSSAAAEDNAVEQGASAGSLFAAGREDEELEDAEIRDANSEGAEDPGADVEFVTSGSSADADYEEEPEDTPEGIEAQVALCIEVMTETLRQLAALKLSAHQRHEQYDE